MTARIREVSGSVSCDSDATTVAAKECVARLTRPDTELTWHVFTKPGSAAVFESRTFRVGDYFTAVESVSAAPGDRVFTLVFRVREDAGPFWKAMMVAFLREVGKRVPGTIVSVVPGSAKVS